jgi:hypothetical protein
MRSPEHIADMGEMRKLENLNVDGRIILKWTLPIPVFKHSIMITFGEVEVN